MMGAAIFIGLVILAFITFAAPRFMSGLVFLFLPLSLALYHLMRALGLDYFISPWWSLAPGILILIVLARNDHRAYIEEERVIEQSLGAPR